MATLKRKKSDGTWETVATPSDFPVQIPVELVEADLIPLSVSENGNYTPSAPHNGYSSVNVNVPSGPTAQVKTGSASTSRTSAGSVNCGFAPDVVFWYGGDVSGYHYMSGIHFTQYTSNAACIYNADLSNIYTALFSRTENGFSFTAQDMNGSRQSLSINYTAVKYT